MGLEETEQSNDFDIFKEEQSDIPSDENLRRVVELAELQLAQEEKVKILSEQLDVESKKLRDISQNQFPSLMDEISLKSFTLMSGRMISVIPKVKASITEPRKEKAFAWLRANNHGGIIKNEVISSFGKGEDEKAASLKVELISKGFETKQKESVHGNTLSAFVRELKESGYAFSTEVSELLGIYEYKFTKIT